MKDYIKINEPTPTKNDLNQYNIWRDYNLLRKQLYKSDLRKDCIIIQGGAFVVGEQAFLLVGIGCIDLLDSLAQLNEVDGIIGNGNSIFISESFDHVYTAHSTKELIDCYEFEEGDSSIKTKFLVDAPLAPLIFLVRAFHNKKQYESTKKKVKNIAFEVLDTFAGPPVKYAGSLKSRLRGKFINTVRVVHCAQRPRIQRKECLFDSYDEVYNSVNKFKGHFSLVYTIWNQLMCEAFGMRNTRKLSTNYNPSDPITPHFLEIVENFYNSHQRKT